MKYRAITANCGNDSLGKKASEGIASSLHKDKNADFYIINCQETSVDETRDQLKKAVGQGYSVTCLAQMTTHTKLSTQFHSHTGIATYIIHRKELTVTPISTSLARRNNSRLSGSGYNKGGLVTDFTVTKNKGSAGEEHLQVQTVSGHLDSNDAQKRTKDWHCINQALSREVQTWQGLVNACPNLRVSGYDANTRNKFTEQGDSVNLWRFPGGTSTPELQALYQAAIAGQHFSDSSTYQTHKEDVTTLVDKKRPGYAYGGMLDFVGIADGKTSNLNVLSEGISRIAVDAKDSARDHDVIISPLQSYTMPVSDFDKVKGQVAQRLERSAPYLAREIIALVDENEENRNKLLAVYNCFLRPNGLINQAIFLHIEKLDFINKFIDPILEKDEQIKESIYGILFPINSSWFEEARVANLAQFAKQFPQQRELMKIFMGSLHPYPGETETNQRIQLYTEQLENIKQQNFNPEEAQQAFREMQIKEYHEFLSRFVKSLEAYSTDTEDKKALLQKGHHILNNVLDIIGDNDQFKTLSLQELGQINSVLKYSYDALDALNKGADIKPIASQLAFVAQNISEKTSSFWRKLGVSLLAFAGISLVVAGVLAAIPTGGTSLLLAAIGTAIVGVGAGIAGATAVTNSPEKELANSVIEFKSALRTLTLEDPSDQDHIEKNVSKPI
jgi:hypothetical protein